MATAKKSAAGAKKAAAKKSSAKKAAPAKKAAVKKAPAKKVAAKGGAAKKATATKTAAKAPAKKAAAKSAAPKKRAVNPALMAPMQPSADLAVVVGNKPMPRGEITKAVWDYIKKNGLQDQQNRRAINADDNLKKVFGGKKQVTMFEMTKLVNNHIKPA